MVGTDVAKRAGAQPLDRQVLVHALNVRHSLNIHTHTHIDAPDTRARHSNLRQKDKKDLAAEHLDQRQDGAVLRNEPLVVVVAD